MSCSLTFCWINDPWSSKNFLVVAKERGRSSTLVHGRDCTALLSDLNSSSSSSSSSPPTSSDFGASVSFLNGRLGSCRWIDWQVLDSLNFNHISISSCCLYRIRLLCLALIYREMLLRQINYPNLVGEGQENVPYND